MKLKVGDRVKFENDGNMYFDIISEIYYLQDDDVECPISIIDYKNFIYNQHVIIEGEKYALTWTDFKKLNREEKLNRILNNV